LPSWIRIRIANPDPETDPGTPLNPDPEHWFPPLLNNLLFTLQTRIASLVQCSYQELVRPERNPEGRLRLQRAADDIRVQRPVRVQRGLLQQQGRPTRHHGQDTGTEHSGYYPPNALSLSIDHNFVHCEPPSCKVFSP
jgi:hypothetical protein